MIADAFPVLLLLAGLGCGLAGGVFFAFSTFVMAGLARLPPTGAVAAMQAINVTAVRPAFMTLFLGTAAASAGVLLASLLRWREPGTVYAAMGAVLYLAGVLGVTAACNVPRNNALAAADASSAGAADAWTRFFAGWMRWNHVRTVACVLAAAALTAAVVQVWRARP